VTPLRIGCVKYLNARPLILGWDAPVEFDHPSVLCRKLAAGDLDVALVSTFEFLENPIYTIVDDVAVGCDGAVESVFLAYRGDFNAIQEIALDPASRTSVNLLRCLLAESGMDVRFPSAPTSDGARLLIGDHAIHFREQHASDYAFRDLGAWWKELTGLPFVFALWLVRPEVAEAGAIAARLRAKRDENLQSLDRVAAAARDFSPDFAMHYFRDCLRFGFADREKTALNEFRLLCERHGILPVNSVSLRLA
jgi:predicted solute-binding protein